MISWIKDSVLSGIRSWSSFWFKPVDTLSVSFFRFCFCSALLVMYLIRFFDIRLFFYESGLMKGSSAKAIQKLINKEPAFDFIIASDMWLYLFYLLFIIILFLMALGLANRFVSLIAFVLHLVFLQRNPSIIFGADVIASFWLFYLVFANAHKQIKWAHYFLNRRKGLISDRAVKGDWLNTMALRFGQIQLCVIYMFSGMEKLKNPSWWEGTAIWEALSFYDFSLVDFSFLLSYPLLSVGLTVFIVLFEIYFPVLVWTSKLRKIALLSGLVLHLGMALSLNTYFFSLIMLSSYILFIPSESLRRFFKKLNLV